MMRTGVVKWAVIPSIPLADPKIALLDLPAEDRNKYSKSRFPFRIDGCAGLSSMYYNQWLGREACLACTKPSTLTMRVIRGGIVGFQAAATTTTAPQAASHQVVSVMR